MPSHYLNQCWISFNWNLWQQISVKIEFKFQYFHSRKCIWKHYLESGGHLVSMCQPCKSWLSMQTTCKPHVHHMQTTDPPATNHQELWWEPCMFACKIVFNLAYNHLMEIVHTWYSDMKYTYNRKIVMFMVLLSVKILKAVYTGFESPCDEFSLD